LNSAEHALRLTIARYSAANCTFATPDDLEALESCQQGFTSGGVEWNDISRGMDRAPQANDEAQMRAFWRQWQRQMGDAACKEAR